jgi:hypothetical protein
MHVHRQMFTLEKGDDHAGSCSFFDDWFGLATTDEAGLSFVHRECKSGSVHGGDRSLLADRIGSGPAFIL